MERGKRQASARCLTTAISLLRTRRGSPGRALSTWLGKRRRVDQNSPTAGGIATKWRLVSTGAGLKNISTDNANVPGATILWNIYPNELPHMLLHIPHYTQYLFHELFLIIFSWTVVKGGDLMCQCSCFQREPGCRSGFVQIRIPRRPSPCTGVILGRPARVRATPRQTGAGSRTSGRGRRGGSFQRYG